MNEPSLEYQTSDADRKCRLCNSFISRGEKAVLMKNIHISPKQRHSLFHKKCLLDAVNNLERSEV